MIAHDRSLVLDTHAWFWLAVGDPKFSKWKDFDHAKKGFQNYELNISAITHWEISMLETKGGITLKLDCLSWLEESIKRTRVKVIELTPEISVAANRLPGEFHGDPADRIIVATTRLINGVLLTKDDRILQYGSKGFVDTLKI